MFMLLTVHTINRLTLIIYLITLIKVKEGYNASRVFIKIL